MSSKPENQTTPKRGRGRPKGSLNKLTIEQEKVRKLMDEGKIGSKKRAGKPTDPLDILKGAASFFWEQAQALREQEKKLADDSADDHVIKAVRKETERQIEMASKCAERAAPYLHARVAPVSSIDGETIVPYVAWLPQPAPSAADWVATRTKQNGGNGTH